MPKLCYEFRYVGSLPIRSNLTNFNDSQVMFELVCGESSPKIIVRQYGKRIITSTSVACKVIGTVGGKPLQYDSMKYFTPTSDFWMLQLTLPYYGFIAGDNLSVECELGNDVKNSMIIEGSHNLYYYTKLLFCNKQYSDFTVIVGTKSFPVHKLILSMRSTVLAAMMQSGFSETGSATMEVTDSSAKVVEAFLYFFYSDKCDEALSAEEWQELFQLAHKYDVQGLQALCQLRMANSLTIKNCFEQLQWATLYEAQSLKESVVKFILSHSAELKQQGEWNKFFALEEPLKQELWNAV